MEKSRKVFRLIGQFSIGDLPVNPIVLVGLDRDPFTPGLRVQAEAFTQ